MSRGRRKRRPKTEMDDANLHKLSENLRTGASRMQQENFEFREEM